MWEILIQEYVFYITQFDVALFFEKIVDYGYFLLVQAHFPVDFDQRLMKIDLDLRVIYFQSPPLDEITNSQMCVDAIHESHLK